MRFELSPANGFMDSSAASRGKVRSPSSLSSISPVFRERHNPISFSCTSDGRSSEEHSLLSRALPMQPRCGRSCHCSGDRYPSSRLRAKVTTLYLESQLMPPPLSRDHPLIIDEPPSLPPPFLRSSCGIYRWLPSPPHPPSPFAAPPRVLEEEARTSGKPKSAIPITRAIYRSRDPLVIHFAIGQLYHRFFRLAC